MHGRTRNYLLTFWNKIFNQFGRKNENIDKDILFIILNIKLTLPIF